MGFSESKDERYSLCLRCDFLRKSLAPARIPLRPLGLPWPEVSPANQADCSMQSAFFSKAWTEAKAAGGAPPVAFLTGKSKE